MSNLKNELNVGSIGAVKEIQPGLEEAVVVSVGSTDSTYTVKLKNGTRIGNVYGPAGIQVGAAIALASFPGKLRQRVIVQNMRGGSSSTPHTVGV